MLKIPNKQLLHCARSFGFAQATRSCFAIHLVAQDDNRCRRAAGGPKLIKLVPMLQRGNPEAKSKLIQASDSDPIIGTKKPGHPECSEGLVIVEVQFYEIKKRFQNTTGRVIEESH